MSRIFISVSVFLLLPCSALWGQTAFSDDMEGGSGNWTFTSNSGTVVWNTDGTPATVVGSPSSVSGSNSLNFNNGTTYDDPATTSGTVFGGATSVTIDISSFTTVDLTFQCNYETEDTSTNWDQRFVRVTDSLGGMPIDDQLSTTGTPVGGACANMGTWHTHTYTLDPAWGQITITFDFDTTDPVANLFAGWFIDDVVVSGTGGTVTTGTGTTGGTGGGGSPNLREGDNGDEDWYRDLCSAGTGDRGPTAALILMLLIGMAVLVRRRVA